MAAIVAMSLIPTLAAVPARIAVVRDALPESDAALAGLAAEGLRARGLQVREVPATFLEDREALSWRRGLDVLILAGAGALPEAAFETIPRFLREGGRLVAMGSERPFSRPLLRCNGRWLAEDGVRALLRRTPSTATVVGLDALPPARWTWATSDPAKRHRATLEDPPEALRRAAGEEASRVLRLQIEGTSGWDTFLSPRLPRGFPAGQTLTIFWARADRNTPAIAVEWQEADGSRWIARVPLRPAWQRIALPPEAFAYWYDSPARGRSGAGDRFDPERAARIAFGIAESHVAYRPGRHTIEIGGVRCAPTPVRGPRARPPVLEILSPWYKQYRTEGIVRSVPDPDQAILGRDLVLDGPRALLCPVRRNPGLGIAPDRTYRFIPLLVARDAGGAARGALASILVSYEGGPWSWFGAPDAAWFRANGHAAAEALARIVERLAGGAFLLEGGAAQAAYFRGEAWRIGARARNGGRRAARLALRARVLRGDAILWERARELDLGPGSTGEVVGTWAADRAAPGLYRVVTELLRAGRAIDRIRQPVRIVSGEPEPGPAVSVRGGAFRLGERRWVPFGLNFWPRYAAGLEPREYGLHWLAPRYYDPEAADEDLRILAGLGMNLVSIQYPRPSMAPALVDFLARAHAHGVRAIVFVPGGFPLRPNLRELEALIRAARLWLWDAVFAYDLAWEPHVGEESARRRYDDRWRRWIEERYGGIEAAERDWGARVPRDAAGRVTGPANAQILHDGPWRAMVAAYRRFLDDEISRGYGEVARCVRRLDPRHLMGVRTGYGGTGSPGIDPRMPFDLASGAAHLDFLSPEGYGLGPSWETTRIGGLVTAYARLVGGGKPVFWAEYGMSVHPQPDPEKLARQGELYESFAHMFQESRADGGAGWWFPGGYRVGERSDFGVIAPDGRPRPAARANARWAERVANPPPRPGAVREILVDRDLHPRGFSALRAHHAEAYLAARDRGEWVVLRTAGTGTTSPDCPAVAVGNRPLTGSNPPKYLNGEFGEVAAAAGGRCAPVRRGGRIEACAGDAIQLRVEVVNTGEAEWVPPAEAAGRPGGVWIVSAPGSAVRFEAAITGRVPFLARRVETVRLRAPARAGPHRLALTFEARGRSRFGERYPLTLAVRAR